MTGIVSFGYLLKFKCTCSDENDNAKFKNQNALVPRAKRIGACPESEANRGLSRERSESGLVPRA